MSWSYWPENFSYQYYHITKRNKNFRLSFEIYKSGCDLFWKSGHIQDQHTLIKKSQKVQLVNIVRHITYVNHFHNQFQRVWFLKYFLRQASDLIMHMWLDLWKPFQIAHWKQFYILFYYRFTVSSTEGLQQHVLQP